MKTAVIGGATGLVGTELCRALVSADSEFDRVVALTRRPLDFSFGGAKLIGRQVADLGSLEDLDLGGPVDAGFSTLGTTIKVAGSEAAFRKVDFDYVVSVAKLARRCGARTFVLLTSVDADAKSSNFYLRVKGEVEDAVAELGFESLAIMRPSFLMGDRKESRPGEKIGIAVARALEFLLVGRFRKYRPIRVEDVARAMARAAREAKPGRHVYHYDELVPGR